MKRKTTLLGGILLLVVSVACSRATPAVGGVSPLLEDSVTVTVVNDNFYDANVYALYQGSTRDRLGTVIGHNSQTFRIKYHPRPLVMQMHLVGVGSTLSNEIHVDPGDVLELRIMPDMHRRVTRGR
jgi:hypothetical protein